MIHVITRHNRHLYTSILEDMFRLRHKIFVQDRGWKKLDRADGIERDQFDTEDTTYFLKLSPEMEILGGMRMYPTTVDTQLNTVFKDTCLLNQQPRQANEYEWSRYFINARGKRSKSGKPVHMELYTGILEYAVAKGIKSLSGFIEIGTYNRSGRMPWEMVPLGPPHEYGGTSGEPVGTGIPVLLKVTEVMLRMTKTAWRMEKPVLSLSLGEFTPPNEAGFKPEVLMEMEKFSHEYPELVGLIAAFADALQDQTEGTNMSIRRFIEDKTQANFMDGFNVQGLDKGRMMELGHHVQ